MVTNIPDMEEILAQMKDKFLETAQEKLDRLNEILQEFERGAGQDRALQEEYLREIHSLKGMGGTFQMPLVTKLCHNFEAFLEGETSYTTDLVNASQLYVDRLSDLIESDEGDNEGALDQWLQGLPQRGDALGNSEEAIGLSALVVTNDDHEIAVIKENFESNGIQVHGLKNPFHAYEVALTKKPSVIIASQTLREMDGAELLRSLGAMKTLSKVQFAMICPDRRQALQEELKGVHLLSQKKLDVDVMNFLAIAVTA
ncbi:Hpt domain-containing protein [Terasakiella sp. A23]|uniref:Hpt domain-containing protein n=1 Tax=Terasakiella sp. FCG-A23 TaxID=3080561 RepID=UPI0029542690|nr:Hpt domain-containing protein [Terasakiella sp. A23]MDV7338688.1 Hpt domain-containing protein [Terasakiella sp. A23]